MPLRDTYKEGTYLRQWGLVKGFPDCLADGVPVDHPGAVEILARNARVRAAITAVEAFEAAQRLVARVEAGDLPAETVTVPVMVDETEERPNPEWTAYQDALSLVSAADDSTLALALLRSTDEPPADLLDDGTANPDRAAYDDALIIMEAINAH